MIVTLCLKLLDVSRHFVQLPVGFHSNEVNMKLIGKFVGVFKMIAATETPWSQTVIPFSFNPENLALNRYKVVCNCRFTQPATNGHTVASLGADAVTQ
jgi:hypothetical protein